MAAAAEPLAMEWRKSCDCRKPCDCENEDDVYNPDDPWTLVEKRTDADNKQFWRCAFCGGTFMGWNRTKDIFD